MSFGMVRTKREFLHFTRKKSRYLCKGTTDLHEIWQNDAERIRTCKANKSLILKAQDGGRPMRLIETRSASS